MSAPCVIAGTAMIGSACGAVRADILHLDVRELGRAVPALNSVAAVDLAPPAVIRDDSTMAGRERRQRRYDHRLKQLVQSTGDGAMARKVGVPRSTLGEWMRGAPAEVVTHSTLGMSETGLQAKVFQLERRVEILTAAMRLLLVLVRVMDSRLDRRRLPNGTDKAAILKAVERASTTIGSTASLRIIGLSRSRYFAWRRGERRCALDDVSTCPRSRPTRLTAAEVATMKEMATSTDYRHVPTTTLARLAQRMGKVYASATSWSRLIRERRWRRPRTRIHPDRAKEGLRAKKPDEAWHVDTTVFRLLDGTKAYLQAVIDNYSR